MGREAIETLISRWKEQYQLLLAEAEDLLRNVDIWGPEAFEGAIARRQGNIEELFDIDTCLVKYLKDAGMETIRDSRLDEFRTFKETATNRILELDSLSIALAGERLAHLQSEIAAGARGKTAIVSYESSGRGSRQNWNDIA
ncbi:hypothetical protein [Geotalea uraniireducens]|uniref:Uncharacterized protein n=1 Tax=Geotalea uraniireducens (strain Rf4) TaxID=351605 RepID=A5G8W7_GEOUR|nr:hypothetical protein [Geotalea uraniireducens]ABQ28235.1 hypothetical protein Gura_4092 [Geotalea uraniireducens Rf4]